MRILVGLDLIPVGAQSPLAAQADHRFVIDDQDSFVYSRNLLLVARNAHSSAFSSWLSSVLPAAQGKTIVTVVPRPSSLSTSKVPECC